MTPVSIYQKIRDKFSDSILLESSDYGANDNSYAYVCFNPISTFKVKADKINQTFPDKKSQIKEINKKVNVVSDSTCFVKICLKVRFKIFRKRCDWIYEL